MRVDVTAKSKLESIDLAVGRPTLGLRLRVRLRRWQLDRDLAAGCVISGSADLALRARRLGEPRARLQTATSIRRVVATARSPRLSLSAAVPPVRAAVLPWAEGLLGLAERLEQPVPLAARGLARAALLVRDGAGPLFTASAGESLGDAIWAISEGLEPCTLHGLDDGFFLQNGRSRSERICARCGTLEAPAEASAARA